MLINKNSVQKSGIRSDIHYRAIVVDNDDSNHKDGKKLGRIKFKILNLIDFDPDLLPWAVPEWNHVDGATNITGSFDVPKKNSFVRIHFERGDVYHPVYSGIPVLENTQLEDSLCHYPNRKVKLYSNSATFILDTEDNSMQVYNPGETLIKSHKKFVIKSEKDHLIILSDTSIGMRAPEIAIRASKHLILESNDKLTMRSQGVMDIETRDTMNVQSQKEMIQRCEEEDFTVEARGDECSDKESSVYLQSRTNNSILRALGEKPNNDTLESNVEIEARGKENEEKSSKIKVFTKGKNEKNNDGKNNSIEITTDGKGKDKMNNSIKIKADGKGKENMKNTISIETDGKGDKNCNVGIKMQTDGQIEEELDSDIVIKAKGKSEKGSANVTVEANGQGEDKDSNLYLKANGQLSKKDIAPNSFIIMDTSGGAEEGDCSIKITANKGSANSADANLKSPEENVNIHAGKVVNITANEAINISAPTVNISGD